MKQAFLNPFAPHHKGEPFSNPKPTEVRPISEYGYEEEDEQETLVLGDPRHDEDYTDPQYFDRPSASSVSNPRRS